MIELRGKYNTAKVFNDNVESEAIGQIINFLNQEAFKDGNIAVMPDVHYGKGAVIGFTAPLGDRVIPNVVGVDVGCSVTAWKLGKRSIIGEKFDKLDKFIRKSIPSGTNIRERQVDPDVLDRIIRSCTHLINRGLFKAELKMVCDATNQNIDYVMNSLGTLGGGNHFIEVDKDDDDNLWLVVHSGSRNFGYKMAAYFQKLAIKSIKSWGDFEVKQITERYEGLMIQQKLKELRESRPKVPNDLAYLKDHAAHDYLKAMKLAQDYAKVNRRVIGYTILERFYKLVFDNTDIVESVHNYISFDDDIIRKGAISAHKGEKVIIPLNMADGCIIGTGRGNAEWNNSAPHGAGRLMSRTKAKATVSLDDFQRRMKEAGVWTSCVGKGTLDEAPQAYKKASHIIKYLKDTVDIDCQMKPVYNFKAVDKKPAWQEKR